MEETQETAEAAAAARRCDGGSPPEEQQRRVFVFFLKGEREDLRERKNIGLNSWISNHILVN